LGAENGFQNMGLGKETGGTEVIQRPQTDCLLGKQTVEKVPIGEKQLRH